MSLNNNQSSVSTERLKLGILMMILTGFFFAALTALAKSLSPAMPLMEIVFFRGLISSLLILPFMIKYSVPLIGNNKVMLFSRGFFGFLALTANFYAVIKLNLSDGVILNNTYIIFVPLLSALLLKERFPLPLYLYVLIGLAGACAIVKPSSAILNSAALIGIASGFLAALAYLSVKKLQDSDHTLTIVFAFTAISALASLIFFYSSFVMPDRAQWILLAGVGITGALGQYTMTKAYAYGPAALIGPYQFSTFLFTLLIGYFCWQEIPDLFSIAGAILIIYAGIKISGLKSVSGEG